ncbi:MAG: T9SS type A sorting domain-containing protein [Candidatus Atribacteria bacterium]|nr:T9SS type A sorting domain-containing protein [Candidatus Atribacteria bacterium]
MKKNLLFVLLILMCFSLYAQTEVTLINPGFEIPDDDEKYNCSNTPINEIPGFGWKLDYCNNVGREDPDVVLGKTNQVGPYEGRQVAYSHSPAGRLYQVVGEITESSVTYDLSCKTIYTYSDATGTVYSSLYFSTFSGIDTTYRQIVSGDSISIAVSDIITSPEEFIAWLDVDASYTTQESDIGKVLCIEFGNSSDNGTNTYFYHDAFQLTKGGTTGVNILETLKTKVFPNPTSGNVNIQSIDGKSTFYKISNYLGEVVKSGNFSTSTQLDLTDLNKGVYFINLAAGQLTEVHKLVIE